MRINRIKSSEIGIFITMKKVEKKFKKSGQDINLRVKYTFFLGRIVIIY